MRLIDVDAFKADYRMADECKDCKTPVRACEYDRVYAKMDFCSWLDDAPTIEPERKTGKWKGYNADNPNWQRDDGSPIFLCCSECYGTVINNGSAHWNFCPNCGADMRGELK